MPQCSLYACWRRFGRALHSPTDAWKKKHLKKALHMFICMLFHQTLHLEVVTDISTPTFLACFRRFIARRGLPAHVYSDCGTNFCGASNILKLLYPIPRVKEDILKFTNSKEIQWHFSPPLAPNFGGLWESGIKSVKHHIKRVIGTSSLNYEEFSTFLSEIEACLNSCQWWSSGSVLSFTWSLLNRSSPTLLT